MGSTVSTRDVTPREQILELLRGIGAPGTFAARRTAAADSLDLEVKGLGQLRFPISRKQAEQLCQVARPARYGKGEQTLLDRRVRDTWEIPKSRVKIDQRRWNRTLLPVLERLRADLGLPDGCRLKAELHALLVYGPGQFFLPHQDSEKADEMVGTLVVTLPSSFKGGDFVVEHQGERVAYRGSRARLSFVAFYADCQHEVRPVKEGYRIVLTYNLMLDRAGAATDSGADAADPATVEALAKRLREHFETPLPPRWEWKKDAPPREPPNRLIYLLDHQYTERGLGWHLLKGNDAARTAALRAAAERCDCELVLALADVHETWSCEEPDWDARRYKRQRRWERDEDDDWHADEDLPVDDPDGYALDDLVDWSITLNQWVDSGGKKVTPVATDVADEEVCATTPSSALEAYASEFEGYMGNYGNTMDRWYHRAAIVLWPRKRAFAVRAESSPAWALDELKQRLRKGDVEAAREMAASLLPFWTVAAAREKRRSFFGSTLRVAEGLDDATLAASLLRPFQLEALKPARAREWVALVKHYGEGWVRSLLAEWAQASRQRWGQEFAWISSLPRLCTALRAADEVLGPLSARLLLQDRWRWLKEGINRTVSLEGPSGRRKALAEFSGPIFGILESAAAVGADSLRQEAVAFLCTDQKESLLPCLVQVLRAAAKKVPPKMHAALGLDTIRRHCVRQLAARLEQPAREEGDWSITPPEGCRCELCITLGEFLADPALEQLAWPIAQEKRSHVHHVLDSHELPVRHETRRSGSPYTLVLTKTRDLFKREAQARRSWQSDLEWLTKQAKTR